jgi:hypothetical protein
MKRKLLLTGVVATLIAGGVYIAVTRGDLIREASELVRDGGERALREPLRPARGGTRVVMVALDGVGRDMLYGGLERGEMPRLSALVGAPAGEGTHEHGYAEGDALSILPSTTMAAWASVFTGEPPARSGVPGNEWFDRGTMRFFAPAPVSVLEYEHALSMLSDGLVGNQLSVPTLFELADVRSYVSLAPVYRGADLLTLPDPNLVAELFGAMVGGAADDEPLEQDVYATLDESAMDDALESLERHGLADLQVVYFPGVDLFTHGASDPLRQQAGYLAEVVDPQVGRLLDVYAAAGALDSTWVVVLSDHGHTPVLSDDRNALSAGAEDGVSRMLEDAGFRMRALVLEPEEDQQDYQAALAYQGAIAYVYLADRSTCAGTGQPCDWARPPRRDEDVLPVARAFHAASTSGEVAPQLAGALDLILVRSVAPDGSAGVLVFDGEGLVPLSRHLAAHPRPDLLRFEERMRGLVDGPHGERAGDIILVARSGEHRPLEERFYFSNRYRSWHGSPHPQDSRIPLLVAHGTHEGAAIREVVRDALGDSPSQLGVVRLILSLLGR